MAESSGSVSVDVERIAFGGKEHLIETSHGMVSVAVFGDEDKLALITYPDVALNHMSCFQGLFFCPEAASLLLQNFCIYHICPPGHEMGAAAISSNVPIPSVDDLADQIAVVLDHFGLGSVMCMGVLAGAYILALFAIKYSERVLGLILVSPLCKAPSWTEWLNNKVLCSFLYFYGMCGLIKERLLQRYFSKEVCGSNTKVPASDIAQACRSLLAQRENINVWRYLQSINRRYDITVGLQRLLCKTLVFVGENSPFYSEALHMMSKLDIRNSALVECSHRIGCCFERLLWLCCISIGWAHLNHAYWVQACGSLVTEEQPHAMLIPLEHFLMSYGLGRLDQSTSQSTVKPCCVPPELLSPESLGIKLKPIKTRVS